MSIQDRSLYSLSDFLDDDLFIRWVVDADPESNAFWKSFQQQHPEKKEIIEQAASIIKVYRRQEVFTNEEHKDRVWDRIRDTVHRQDAVRTTRIVPLYYRVAAAIAFVLASSAVLWLVVNSNETITTAYGEVRTIELPDHSTVTLNGNSSISFKDDWDRESPREIWLEGEALFDVQHINRDTLHIVPGDRFIVHSNGVNIEVLGTTFNVEHRRDQTNIALITGKVKVHLADKTSTPSEDIIMAPGDYVAYKKETLVEKKKLKKLTPVTAWTKNEFAFVDPYLRDIVKTLRDDHGYSIDVKEEKLMALRIEGEISVATVQELLSTVEVTLGLKIKESNKHIVISRK